MHDDEDDDTRALAVAPDPARGPLTTLDVIQRAVMGGVGPEMLDRLMAMKREAEARADAQQFAAAMAKFQAECKKVLKATAGNRGKYASIDDMQSDELNDLLAECGLVVTFTTEDAPAGTVGLVCHVRHGAHAEPTRVAVPISPIQGAPAAASYAGAVTTAQRLALRLALRLRFTDRPEQAAPTTLTPEEAATIARLIGERAVDEAKLFAFAGAAAVAAIPRSKFATIRDLLLKKPLKGGAQ